MTKSRMWIITVGLGILFVLTLQVPNLSAAAKQEKESLDSMLEQVIANQEKIMQQLVEVKEGLRIIKVRSSR